MTWLYSGEFESNSGFILFDDVEDEDDDDENDDEEFTDELLSHIDERLDIRACAMAVPMLVHFSPSDAEASNLLESKLDMSWEADELLEAVVDWLAVVVEVWCVTHDWKPTAGIVCKGLDVRLGNGVVVFDRIGVEHMALRSLRMPSRMRISKSILLFSSSFFIMEKWKFVNFSRSYDFLNVFTNE
jgi:hypothetical protein